jgi:hypothetical protein
MTYINKSRECFNHGKDAYSIDLTARRSTRAGRHPRIVIIPIQIDAHTCAERVRIPILPPHTVHRVRVLVPVRVHHRHHVHLVITQQLHRARLTRRQITQQAVYHVQARRHRDPLSLEKKEKKRNIL